MGPILAPAATRMDMARRPYGRLHPRGRSETSPCSPHRTSHAVGGPPRRAFARRMPSWVRRQLAVSLMEHHVRAFSVPNGERA